MILLNFNFQVKSSRAPIHNQTNAIKTKIATNDSMPNQS